MARVAVGLPVHQGERYLEAAIDSILGQTFEDLELVISDNASTDGTEAIARAAIEHDPRVRYLREDENRGAAWNFERVFAESAGEYFRWAAHDDLLEPELLAECVAVLDADPSVVLCTTSARVIDAEGEVLGDHDDELERISSPRACERFADLIRLEHWCLDVFGLVRREVLARTPRIASFVGSDRNLLAELALHGGFYRVPRPLFLSREHPERSINKATDERATWFDPRQEGGSRGQIRRRLREYLRAVGRAPLGAAERAGCRLELVRWCWRYRRPLLGEAYLELVGGRRSRA